MKQSLYTRSLSLSVVLFTLTLPVYGSEFIYYQEDFESGDGGFVIDNTFGNGNGLWHLSTSCQSAQDGHSAPTTLAYADDSGCDYVDGLVSQGVADSPPIMLYGSTNTPITLKVKYYLGTEGSAASYDKASIEVSENGDPFVAIAHNDSFVAPVTLTDGAGAWLEATADLTAYAGSSIQLRFGFDTVDDQANENPGFYIDDIVIYNPPIYHEDFENGDGGFTIDNGFGNGNGLWHLSTSCESAQGGHSAPTALAYADDAECSYVEGVTSQGVADSPVIDLSGYANAPVTLKVKYYLETENSPASFDKASIEVSENGGPFIAIAHNDSLAAPVTLTDGVGSWVEMTADLTAFSGSSIQLRFGFDTLDSLSNSTPGFYVDDIIIESCLFRPAGDVSGDCRVDLVDVALLAQNWLVDCNQSPPGPGCLLVN